MSYAPIRLIVGKWWVLKKTGLSVLRRNMMMCPIVTEKSIDQMMRSTL